MYYQNQKQENFTNHRQPFCRWINIYFPCNSQTPNIENQFFKITKKNKKQRGNVHQSRPIENEFRLGSHTKYTSLHL